MKLRTNDMTHCFRHANTHRQDEPCANCEVERLQRELGAARQRVAPLIEREREGQDLGDVLDFRVRRPRSNGMEDLMTTRCKVKCDKVAKVSWGGGQIVHEAEFSVVTSGSEENKQFFAATPGGNARLCAVRGDHFEAGKEYYVDFTPAEQSAASSG